MKNDQINKIEPRIKNLEHTISTMKNDQYQMTIEPQIKSLEDSVSTMKKMNQKLENSVDQVHQNIINLEQNVNPDIQTIKKDFQNFELYEASKTLIIRNVPYHPSSTEYESKKQTQLIVHDIFDTLKLNHKPINFDCIRFKHKKNRQSRNISAPIKLKLSSQAEIHQLYKNIRNLKNSKFQNVSFCPHIPKSTRAPYQKLDKIAYAFRKEQTGSLSKILMTNNKFVLFGKRPGETQFLYIAETTY